MIKNNLSINLKGQLFKQNFTLNVQNPIFMESFNPAYN